MGVPIKYTSSKKYNAGVTVEYDDDLKRDFAPFIYAGVEAGSQDDGGDEEGEDVMVIHLDDSGTALDKSWNEIKNAVVDGKVCVLIDDYDENDIRTYYLYNVYNSGGEYGCVFSYYVTANTFNSVTYTCDSADGFPVHVGDD